MKANGRHPIFTGTLFEWHCMYTYAIIYNVYLWMTHQAGISESSLAYNKMLTALQSQYPKKLYYSREDLLEISRRAVQPPERTNQCPLPPATAGKIPFQFDK